MAPTIGDLTSQYDVLKSIVSQLWPDDLVNLACTSKANLGDIRRKDHADFGKLAECTLRCDGSSGRLWQHDWASKPVRQTQTGAQFRHDQLFPDQQAAVNSTRAQILSSAQCETFTTGPRASNPCGICGEPVCGVGQASVPWNDG